MTATATKPKFWTPERDALAYRLYVTDGLPADVVAARIGAQSAAAISSRGQREGWAVERSPVVRRANARAAHPRAGIVPQAPRVSADQLRYVLSDHPKRLEELEKRQCRFPVGPLRAAPALFCAQAISGDGPYCPRCRQVAYGQAGAVDRNGEACAR